MEAALLLKKVIEHGADAKVIADLFLGNDELYRTCFMEFIHEPAFAALEAAMASGDHEAAFSAAHAIKGISGNLGLTAMYKAACTLVESLRAKSYGGLDAEYAQVRRQHENLLAVAAEAGA